jgi:Rad3-related DNA helicase
VGRLIRRQSDTGRIVILDSRVLKQSYGRAFLEVLPVERHERFSRHNREHLRRA